MPLSVWLGFPEGFLVSCYQIGMVRWMLVESCKPDWGYVERLTYRGSLSSTTMLLSSLSRLSENIGLNRSASTVSGTTRR